MLCIGKFNIGEAVISANYGDMRVDIDADESVHHIKSDNMEVKSFFTLPQGCISFMGSPVKGGRD